MPTTDVAQGQSGEEVGRLQLALKIANGQRLDEDGRFGAATLTALNAYQQSAGLPQKATADSTLRTALAQSVKTVAEQMQQPKDGPRLGVPPLDELSVWLDSVVVIAGEGDKTGYYAPADRTGFAYGDGPESKGITQGSPAHIAWIAGDVLSPSEVRVIGTISSNEGPFDAVNSYDAGYYTWGAYQLIGAYRQYAYQASADELAQGLAVQKELDPFSFSECFQRYGIDVDYALHADGTLDQSSVRITLTRADGTKLAGKDVWVAVGTETKLNQIFINAGRDLRIQRTHILGAKAIHFDALDLPLQTGLANVRSFFTSERLVAGFLDMELNRGRTSARNTFWQAVQNVAVARGLTANAPATWPAADRKAIERDIFEQALALAPTQRYHDRLARVGTSVYVSDAAASFVSAP